MSIDINLRVTQHVWQHEHPHQHHKSKPKRIMKITALASAILAVAQGALALPARAPALDITLSQVNNTRIKAVVKNSATEKITFVHLNFFNDPSPVKKVSLYRNGILLPFPSMSLLPRKHR